MRRQRTVLDRIGREFVQRQSNSLAGISRQTDLRAAYLQSRARQKKARERREKAIAKAQAALDEAMREHHERAATLNDERDALEKKSQAKDERWALEKKKLESALRRARD